MFRIYIIVNLTALLLVTQLSFPQGFRGLEHCDTSYTCNSSIDVKIFRAINNVRNGFSNTVIPITDKSVLPVSVALPLGLMGISRIKDNYYDENSGVLLLLSEITSAGVTFGMKQIFKRERPFVTLSNVYHNKYNSPTDRYSFPSGHTATAFSMATSLTLRYPDKPAIIVISYLYAAITGYGRMYLGVHYPSDILGGMLIGSGSAALIYSLRKEITDFKNSILNEKNRPDINSANQLSTPLILGFTIGADLLDNLIQNAFPKRNIRIISSDSKLTAILNF
ncbi:MAG: phosphatase PAP2 family protein [Ignavibacteria bacterium]